MMGLDAGRLRAVIGKELRDYRRKRSIVAAMIILPALFLVEPVVTIFLIQGSASGPGLDSSVVFPLLYLLLIPVVTPSTLAAYTVVGEREQGTLEPLLTTPIRRQELILGKAAAVIIPTLALSYLVFVLFLSAVALLASAAVVSAVFAHGPVILALLLFTPLLAGWSVMVGMAVSVRASEVRVAQQLGMLASFPPVGLIALLAFGVIQPTFLAAVLFAAGLLAVDAATVRIVARMFDRERLIATT